MVILLIHSPVPGSRHTHTHIGRVPYGWQHGTAEIRTGVKSEPHRASSRVVVVAGAQRARTLRARGSTRPGRVTRGLTRLTTKAGAQRIRLRRGSRKSAEHANPRSPTKAEGARTQPLTQTEFSRCRQVGVGVVARGLERKSAAVGGVAVGLRGGRQARHRRRSKGASQARRGQRSGSLFCFSPTEK